MARRYLFLAGAVMLAGAGPAAAAEIGVALPTLSLESLPILVAQERGFFTAHHVAVNVVASRGGGDAMRSFIAGDVAMVATGFPEIALMKGKGVEAQLLVSQTTRPSFELVARADLGVKSIADLKGKDIAVSSAGSLTEHLTRYLALQQGWDAHKDIGIVAAGGGAEMLGALTGKKVDAAMLMEPFVSLSVANGSATVVVDMFTAVDAFPTGPLVVSKSFEEKSPAETKAVHDAMVDALLYMQENRAGATEVAHQKFPAIKPALLNAIMDRLYRAYSRDGKFSPDNIRRSQEICQELGITSVIYPYEELVAAIDR